MSGEPRSSESEKDVLEPGTPAIKKICNKGFKLVPRYLYNGEKVQEEPESISFCKHMHAHIQSPAIYTHHV